MKKLIAISVVFALAAGVAFAQLPDGVGMGIWGRTAFVPLQARMYNGGAPEGWDGDQDLTAELGPSWGWGDHGRPARLGFVGNSDYVGFEVQIQTDGGSVGLGDFAYMWVKPFEVVKLSYGHFMDDTLRGKVGDTDFHNFTLNMSDACAIFTRFGNDGGAHEYMTQALLSITPVEGLFFGIQLRDLQAVPGNSRNFAGKPAGEIYDKIQIGAGYVIEGVGHARLQYVGAPKFWPGMFAKIDAYEKAMAAYDPSKGDPPPADPFSTTGLGDFKRVEVAFALLSVEGMTLDIGVKLGFPESEKDMKIDISAPIQFNLGFDMGFGDFGINAKLDTQFAGDVKGDGEKVYEAPMHINFHLVPTYNLGVAQIGLELGMDITGSSKSMNDEGDLADDKNGLFDFGAGLWVKKGLGPGHIKAGLGMTMLDLKRYGEDSDAQKNKMNMIFRIPIIAELYFF